MAEWSGVPTATLARLERYRFQPQKTHAGAIRGERLSPRKGISIEFADYRHYAPGDDLRHLDWNILARLDRAYLRTYQDEQELPIHLLLDCSASMAFGEPSKFDFARTLAACLGYIALVSGDALYPVALHSQASETRALRGRVAYSRLVEWLRTRTPDGRALSQSLQRFAHANMPTGMVLLLTDGLDENLPQALRALGGRRHEVVCLQILSEAELDPDLEGDLKLIDAETGEAVEITATSGVLAEYQRRLNAHLQAIQQACRRIGAFHFQLTNRDDPVEVILKRLYPQGIVR
ncbi:MAG: hypothetical protein KatS3mg021_1846 [Fimbriimonadales bacterium]|jgi:uncharacterized protein (DUF58 family)|nr:hypothetical protein HRbin14_00503 [bacterium HR14]GIV13564.1 MAG: hypothetical protein KatS3mg021_1846 [Fimbriimonadales bacterium]CUU35415.1 Protein of unknown function DUF58 [Armatimonadetes bacterium GXS]